MLPKNRGNPCRCLREIANSYDPSSYASLAVSPSPNLLLQLLRYDLELSVTENHHCDSQLVVVVAAVERFVNELQSLPSRVAGPQQWFLDRSSTAKVAAR